MAAARSPLFASCASEPDTLPQIGCTAHGLIAERACFSSCCELCMLHSTYHTPFSYRAALQG